MLHMKPMGFNHQPYPLPILVEGGTAILAKTHWHKTYQFCHKQI